VSHLWHMKSSNLLARWGHRPLRAALDAIPGPTGLLARLPNVPVDRAIVTANKISVLGSHRPLWAAFLAPARGRPAAAPPPPLLRAARLPAAPPPLPRPLAANPRRPLPP